MSLLSPAARIRRTVSALALPAIPLTLLIGLLISPTDSTRNATQLRVAAAHPGQWQAAALLELLAAALLPLAVAGIVRPIHGRGTALAHLGAVLGGLGTLGLAGVGFRHLYIYGLTATHQSTALAVLDRHDNHAGAVALPLLIAASLALIVLSAAAARAGLASHWVILGAFLFAITDFLPIPAAEEIQGLIGVTTFATLALSMLRSETEHRTEAEYAQRSSAAPALSS